jgi:hypothetical protein
MKRGIELMEQETRTKRQLTLYPSCTFLYRNPNQFEPLLPTNTPQNSDGIFFSQFFFPSACFEVNGFQLDPLQQKGKISAPTRMAGR